MWNDADASPPPPPTFRASSEIDVVENELIQGTPNLEFEIRDLIESLKEQGISSRALLASFAEKHTAVLEYMCKTALGARDMDKVPLSLMIGAAALVTHRPKGGSYIGRVAVTCHQKLFSCGFLCCTIRNRLPPARKPLTITCHRLRKR